jgi:Zn-dependent protease
MEATVSIKQRSYGFLLLLLKSTKVFKAIKFGKIFITLGTMFLSVLVYSFRFGFEFALGFVLLLLIHEMGHVAVIKRCGYLVNAFVFILMLGVVIYMFLCKFLEEEAQIGLGGPLLGGIASLALFTYWLYMPVKSDMILFLSYVSTFVNLFNLIPIRPFDGGRITQAIGSWVRWVGVAALLAFVVFSGDPSLIILWILVIGDTNISKKLKAIAGLTAQSTMIVLLAFGIGLPHSTIGATFLILTYTLLATVLNLLLCLEANNKTESPERKSPIYVYVENSLSTKVKWGVIYIALTVSLFILLHIQVDFVHHIMSK